MISDRRDRRKLLFEIKTHEFTNAMAAHGIPHAGELAGEYVYYLTEMWFTWPDFGYDAEHGYIPN